MSAKDPMRLRIDTVIKENTACSWIQWSLSVLIIICGAAPQIGYSIFSSELGTELDLSSKNIALAESVHLWTFAIFQLFAGAILDNFGTKKTLPIATMIITAGTFALACSNGLLWLILTQILLGIGCSFGFIGSSYITHKWFGLKNFGMVFGLVQTISSVSIVLIQVYCAIWTAQSISWRLILEAMGLINLLALFLVFFCIQDKNAPIPLQNHHTMHSYIHSLITTTQKYSLWICGGIGGVLFGSFLANSGFWGPKLLIAKGITLQISGQIISLSWLGLACGSPLVNWMANFSNSRKTILLIFAIMQSLCTICFALSMDVLWLSFLSFCIGFFAGSHMLAFTIGTTLVNSNQVATASALINSTMFLISGIMMLVPTICNAVFFVEAQFAFFLFSMLIFFACIITILIPKSCY